MKKPKPKIYISFVGINYTDNTAGKTVLKSDGAVLTALNALKNVDEVFLLSIGFKPNNINKTV